MPKKNHIWRHLACAALCFPLLSGCSPALDWREIRATEAPYTVLMPAKPAVHTRKVTLDGIEVDMTMRGAEVDGVTYAVGTVVMPDEQQAAKAAGTLQAALVRNLAGSVQQQKSVNAAGLPMSQILASGKSPRGEAIQLHARFASRGNRAYQVIVFGPASKVSTDAADTFLESFRPIQQ
ncbi:hypothetical protein [Lacisediminimonas profundi]|uniref:hypothetical protein n=1 Tax=Lacisediminimonas profundi TaxID=2603856 RepID=UPI00124B9BC2|nr:hypothetical protein [Lacisediminimonas profundi]